MDFDSNPPRPMVEPVTGEALRFVFMQRGKSRTPLSYECDDYVDPWTGRHIMFAKHLEERAHQKWEEMRDPQREQVLRSSTVRDRFKQEWACPFSWEEVR
eukprot:6408380-Prymnesium_polylepis.1